jgi:multidrug efflux pump
LTYQGISPEDSERLLLRPVETKLKSDQGRQGDALGRL